jgi:catechol 2,3-dioxygenase-like lactoylglutathione lyase family enzyme
MIVHPITPILNVSDIRATFEWFAKLGWTDTWQWDDPPNFGSVGVGRHVKIFLCLNGQGGRGKDGAWMSIWVDDVDAIYEQCIANGVEVTIPPMDKPWNAREMNVRHPDGHTFRIAEQLEEEEEEEK